MKVEWDGGSVDECSGVLSVGWEYRREEGRGKKLVLTKRGQSRIVSPMTRWKEKTISA